MSPLDAYVEGGFFYRALTVYLAVCLFWLEELQSACKGLNGDCLLSLLRLGPRKPGKRQQSIFRASDTRLKQQQQLHNEATAAPQHDSKLGFRVWSLLG